VALTDAFAWLRPNTVAPELTASTVPPSPSATTRLPGPDVTRALALIGVVVMNYHGYLNGSAAEAGSDASFAQSLFDPWTGVLSTRFAATFVLMAGVGVTLLTNRSRVSGDHLAVRADRWRLARRGFVLYALGFVLDWIWPGTILFYYGAFFAVAALIFTLRSRWVLLVGGLAAIAGAVLAWWGTQRRLDGADTDWLFRPDTLDTQSPRGLLFDTFVNGTHPVFPWLAFLCLGIVVGRLLPALPRVALGAGSVVAVAGSYALGHVVRSGSDDAVMSVVFSTRPFDRGVLYTVGAAGTALLAFCVISWIAERSRDGMLTKVLQATGRTTLSLYLLHVFVFRLLVDVAGVIGPTGLDTSLTFALVFWLFAIVLATVWTQVIGQGPAERLYRRFGG
jgi:uncharacterized membrane protein YeiB